MQIFKRDGFGADVSPAKHVCIVTTDTEYFCTSCFDFQATASFAQRANTVAGFFSGVHGKPLGLNVLFYALFYTLVYALAIYGLIY